MRFIDFVNTRIGRFLCGVKENYPVVKIAPGSIHYLVGKNTYKATFGFKNPISEVIHFWDKIANRFFPSLNLGFDTFNSNGGGDGSIANTGTVYATVRDAADGQTLYDTHTTADASQQAFFTPTYYMTRGFWPFDTSSLPDDATVTVATLSLYVNSFNNAVDADSVCVVQSTQASNTALALADYDQVGTTDGGNLSYASLATGQYNVITLNATGRGWISLTGYTKLATRNLNDLNNQAPSVTTVRNDFNANTADNASNKPVL